MLWKQIRQRTDQTEPRVDQGFSMEGPRAKESTAGRIYTVKAVKVSAGIGVLALCAAGFYRVRELLAALILFSVLFGTVAIAALILWLVEQGAHIAAARLETLVSDFPSRRIFAPAHLHAHHSKRTPPWN
jgi:hypothetical protein